MDDAAKRTPPSPSAVAVLVVDDDRDIRETLRAAFEEEGYTVFEAPDGMSALERLRTHPFPLIVLLDWWMPGMDGLSVLRALAADAPAVQPHVFLLLTAAQEEANARLSTDVAAIPASLAVTVLGKPFDLDDLLAFVARAAKHLAMGPAEDASPRE